MRKRHFQEPFADVAKENAIGGKPVSYFFVWSFIDQSYSAKLRTQFDAAEDAVNKKNIEGVITTQIGTGITFSLGGNDGAEHRNTALTIVEAARSVFQRNPNQTWMAKTEIVTEASPPEFRIKVDDLTDSFFPVGMN